MKKIIKKVGAGLLAFSIGSFALVSNASAATMEWAQFTVETLGMEDGLQNFEIKKTKSKSLSGTLRLSDVYYEEYRLIGIGNAAFWADTQNLTGVILPNTLRYIGSSAFSGHKIASIEFPDSLKTIQRSAFSKNELTTLVIPDSVEEIAEYAFSQNNLLDVKLPEGQTVLSEHVFEFNKLTNIDFPSSLTEIQDYAFASNQFKKLNLPDHITKLGGNAFYNNQIESLTLSKNLTEIQTNTFRNNQLTSLEIPNGVVKLGENSFANNKLETVHIPPSVIEIAANAFQGNPSTIRIIGEKGSFAETYAKNNGYTFEVNGGSNPEPEPEPENPEQPSSGGTQAEREIEANILTGDLTLDAPTNKSFGNVQLENNPKTVKAGLNGPVQVSDLRGTQEGWRLDVSATQFEIVEPTGGFAEGTISHKLPKGSLSIESVQEIKRVGTGSSTLPVANQSNNKIIDDGSITVATAAKGTGMGDFHLLFDDNAYSLVVDATTVKVDMVNYPDGKTPYKASVTWNLVSAP